MACFCATTAYKLLIRIYLSGGLVGVIPSKMKSFLFLGGVGSGRGAANSFSTPGKWESVTTSFQSQVKSNSCLIGCCLEPKQFWKACCWMTSASQKKTAVCRPEFGWICCVISPYDFWTRSLVKHRFFVLTISGLADFQFDFLRWISAKIWALQSIYLGALW